MIGELEKRTYTIRKSDGIGDVSGYVFDSGIEYLYPVLIGVDKRHNGRWYLTDLNTGLSLGGWFPTRKKALESFEGNLRKRLSNLVHKSLFDEHGSYAVMMSEFDLLMGVRKWERN